jgi:hypothetical protein
MMMWKKGKVSEMLTRLITMGLLDTSGGGSSLLSGLGCQLLTRGLATGGFA